MAEISAKPRASRTTFLVIGDADPASPIGVDRLQRQLDEGLVSAASDVPARIIVRDGTMPAERVRGAAAYRRRQPALICLRAGPVARAHRPGLEEVVIETVAEDAPLITASFAGMGLAGDVVVLAIGDSDDSRVEIRHALRMGWPVIRLTEACGEEAMDLPGDEAIVTLGPAADPSRLRAALMRLSNPDETLLEAWATFCLYDHNAIRHQGRFNRLQRTSLQLAVLGTALALISTALFENRDPEPRWLYHTLDISVLTVPILISILLAAINDFASGMLHLSLRAGAEAVKREIYLYRARCGAYRRDRDPGKASRTILAERLRAIGEQMMETEVHGSALVPYTGPLPPPMWGVAEPDDGLSPLTAQSYLRFRLEDQHDYYLSKAGRSERQLLRLQWATYAAGGIGTLLAAIGLELWLPLTTAVASAVTTHLAQHRIAETLMKLTQSARDLAHVRQWFTAHDPGDRNRAETRDKLVVATEDILARELADWVSRMQDVLKERNEGGDGES